jgi:cyclohexa-1,5-dienecarbonyl-CoA hydratase
MADPCFKAWTERDGALLRLRLSRPKANLVDAEMIRALHGALVEFHKHPGSLRGALLDAEGPHFSFGASVEEHLPDRCAKMLGSLHALLVGMLEFPVPILVAVRGQCLGGGLEVALAAGPIFAAPTAQFGQPEIKLGVFAPAASVLLPYRVSQPVAEDLLFSGRSVSGAAWCRRWRKTPRPPRSAGSKPTCRSAAAPRWRARWPPPAARCWPMCAAASPKSNAFTSSA